MASQTVPVDWSRMRHVTKDEWHGPCPFCGGRDRFVVWKDRNYGWCRPGLGHCGFSGFLDSKRVKQITPQERQRLADEQLAREIAEARRRQAALKKFNSEFERGYYLVWHDAMQEQQRQWWAMRGLPAWALDFWQLGYLPEKTVEYADTLYKLPCYTIPVLEPGTHYALNMTYRLIADDSLLKRIGKYRQHAGLPPAAFFADTDRTSGDEIVVVEGPIKAMVLFASGFMESNTQTMGLPTNRMSDAMIAQLENYARVYLMYDPDSIVNAIVAAQSIGERARVVELTAKPDDLLTQYGGTIQDIRRAMQHARAF